MVPPLSYHVYFQILLSIAPQQSCINYIIIIKITMLRALQKPQHHNKYMLNRHDITIAWTIMTLTKVNNTIIIVRLPMCFTDAVVTFGEWKTIKRRANANTVGTHVFKVDPITYIQLRQSGSANFVRCTTWPPQTRW